MGVCVWTRGSEAIASSISFSLRWWHFRSKDSVIFQPFSKGRKTCCYEHNQTYVRQGSDILWTSNIGPTLPHHGHIGPRWVTRSKWSNVDRVAQCFNFWFNMGRLLATWPYFDCNRSAAISTYPKLRFLNLSHFQLPIWVGKWRLQRNSIVLRFP